MSRKQLRSQPEWACGAAGSALPWHGRGRRFDPDQVHHTDYKRLSLLLGRLLLPLRTHCFTRNQMQTDGRHFCCAVSHCLTTECVYSSIVVLRSPGIRRKHHLNFQLPRSGFWTVGLRRRLYQRRSASSSVAAMVPEVVAVTIWRIKSITSSGSSR